MPCKLLQRMACIQLPDATFPAQWREPGGPANRRLVPEESIASANRLSGATQVFHIPLVLLWESEVVSSKDILAGILCYRNGT